MNNQANLTNEDRENLELLLKSSPSLKIDRELKAELIWSEVDLDFFKAFLGAVFERSSLNPVLGSNATQPPD